MSKTLAYSQVGVVNVDDGNGIQSSIIEYSVYSSGDTPPGNPLLDGDGNPITSNNGLVLTDGSWSTTIPTVPDGQYLWTRTRFVLSDGTFDMIYNVSRSGEKGSTGAQGVSVVNVIPEYRLSDSSSELTGSGAGYSWSETKPKVESGQYIWERQRNELSNNTVVYSDAVCDVTMSGVVFDVDQNKKAISQKVWQSDLTTAINQYDSTKAQSIRDRVTATEQDINGITSTVSDVQSTLSTKADGSALTTLQNTVSQNEQTASQFRQTVQSTYARLTDVDSKISDIKISGHNLYIMKNDVPGYINSSGGTIATQSSTYKERTSEYIPVKEGETYVVQSWVTPNTAGQSWLAYQFYTNNTGTPSGGRTAKYGGDSGSGVETTADGQEHLTYKFTIPSGVKYLRVSYRQFEDGYAMIEKATKPSEYAINPEDLEKYADDIVETAKSEIKQTTDNISLEVSRKVGADEVISKINQSPENITISANKVDLVGHVTFSMLDSAAQKKVNDAQSTADNAVSKAEVADEKAAVGLGMKVNYSTFSTVDPGECYLHGYTNDVAADVDGYVYWNGIKRTVPKKMFNPNDVLPYLQTIYIVFRLSSANATTGTLYMVYYNNGWKYAVTPTPTASTTGDWTWTENIDIVLGQFVEPSNEGQIVDAYLYDPPRNASHVITTGQNPYKYSQAAVSWVNTNGSSVVTAKDIINNWATDATNTMTTIDGGLIETHTILSRHLATDAIMSNNYIEGPTNSPYSSAGTFLDLSDGNIYMPNFGVNAITGAAYFNGTITAVDGMIGSDSTNYWQLGTITDYNGNDSAALVGHGTSYIQSGKWMISEDRIDTRWYDANRKYMYILNGTTYWDYGMQVPDPTSNLEYEKNFLYIRKHANTIPTLESDWDYPFRVTSDGKIYATDIIITGGGSGSTYLPLAGGTITGNLTVNGTLTATASQANKVTHSLSVNGKSFDGSATVTVGTLGVGYGGTGQTTFTSGAVLIGNGGSAIQTRAIRNNTSQGALGWTSSTTDNTIITTNTLAYWNGAYSGTTSNLEYVKLGKLGTVVTHNVDDFITTSGGVIDGSLSVTDLQAGNLVVTGAGRFTNGLYGDLTGNVTGIATHATKVKDIGNNTDTTFAYSKAGLTTTSWVAAWNNYELRAIAPATLKTVMGLNNVDNTADANKSVAYATSAGSATTATSATSATTATTATYSYYPKIVASNEIRFDVSTKPSTATNLHIGYKWSDGSSDAKITRYIFDNGNAAQAEVQASTFYGALSGNASTATTAGSLTTGRDFTIGETTKTAVKWDGAVSFTKANISGLAQPQEGETTTGSNMGWMSGNDKWKLDQINISDIGRVAANSIVGSAGISVSISSGVATVSHSNSAITAGTISGTATSTLSNGGSFKIPSITYNAYGHITSTTTTTITLPTITTITGNAGTATKFASAQSVTLTGDTTGTASSQAGWSITTKTDRISTVGDNRDVATTPNDYNFKIIFQGLKTNNKFGSPSTDTYSYVVGLRGWGDSSGGNSHELAFNNSGIYRRDGATTTWGNWFKILDSDNYTDYAPTKTGSGASGTWGISITGNAVTATTATTATTANRLAGFSSGGAATTCSWGNQTGTAIYVGATPAGGGIFFRDNNPSSGKVSMGIDGVFYQNEGNYACLDTNSYSNYALPLTGGTMTGIINLPYNKQSVSFRSDHSSYDSGFVYGTSGNEALALVNQNAVTSFMVVHGSDPASWISSTWNSVIPTIQTKNKSLYVNELISSGVTPSYNFKVNGSSYLGGEVKISNSNADTESVSLVYDADMDCLNFVFN